MFMVHKDNSLVKIPLCAYFTILLDIIYEKILLRGKILSGHCHGPLTFKVNIKLCACLFCRQVCYFNNITSQY